MATLNTIFRLAFQGGTETRKQLEDIAKGGDAAEKAFKKLDEAGKKVPASLRAVDTAAASVKGNLEGVAGRLGVLGQAANALGTIGTVAAAGAVGITAIGAGFAALTRHAFDAAGALVDAADATGVSIEQLQKYHIAAATAGVSSEQFNDALLTLNKNVGLAETGGGKLSKLLEKIDQDFLNNLKSATSAGERFDLLAQKLANTESASQRVALATAAGGTAMVKLLPLLKDGENGFEELGAAAERAGAIMSDDAARAADEAADKFTALGAVLTGQVNAAFLQTAPLIENIAEAALDAIPSVLAFVNSFLPAATNNEALRRLEGDLAKKRNELDNINAQGFTSSSLQGEIAELEKEQQRLRDLGTEAAERRKKENAQRIADIRAEMAATQAAVDAKIAADKKERDAAADSKKAASEAAADAKRATQEHARGLEQLQELRDKDTTAALEGIAAIEAERDIAYRKWAEQAEEANLTQEQLAEGYFLIWSDAEKRISAERQKEADKQAEIAERAAEKAAREAEKLADAQADALLRPMENLADNIGDTLGDALITFVDDGKIHFDDLWESFRNSALQAIADVVSQQISLNIIAAVTGQQQPGQITNLFGTGPGQSVFGRLTNGVTDLAGSIFSLNDSVQLATQSNINLSGTLQEGVPFTGVTDTGAPFTGSAAPGASQFPDTSGTAGVVSQGAGALGGAAMGGIIIGILGAVLGTVGAIDSLRRGRRFASSQEDIVDLLNKGAIEADPTGLARIVGADRATRGTLEDNPSAIDRSIAAVLTIGTSELVRLAGLTPQPPTGGTVGRANFEKRVEQVTDFFENDFDRSLGQDFARNFVDAGKGEFREGLLAFGQKAADSIDLSPIQAKILRAAAGVARADLGDDIGSEPQRNAALYATLVGNLAEKGADAANSLAAAKQVLDSFGPPPKVFDLFSDFITSGDNDIVLEDQQAIIEGLAAAYFGDLIPAQTAARIALEEFAATGKLSFADIKKEVEAAAAEFQILAPLLAELAQGVAADPDAFFVDGLVGQETLDSFKDAVAASMRDGVIQGFLAGTLESTFNPLFAPIFADQQQIIKDLNEGKITPEQASAGLADVGERFAESLDKLDPVIRQTVENVALISRAFGLAGDAAEDSAEEIAAAFDRGIDRSILGILSPNLPAQFDLEVTQRNRLKAAREAGADLARVEYLNGLEREALAEAQAERILDIERQAAEQIERIRAQFFAQVERGIEGVADKLKAFQQTPSAAVTPEAALAAAQAEFTSLANAARGGDLEAIEDLPAAADTLAALITSLFGSTGQAAALLEPLFATLAEIAGLDPGSVKLSADAQAQIDAINRDAAEQIANENKNHAEAMALFEAMLADLDLIVGAGGETPSSQGTLKGDHIVKGIPGPEGDGIRGNDELRVPGLRGTGTVRGGDGIRGDGFEVTRVALPYGGGANDPVAALDRIAFATDRGNASVVKELARLYQRQDASDARLVAEIGALRRENQELRTQFTQALTAYRQNADRDRYSVTRVRQ